MEEITIFIFGLVATLLVLGPLAVAFYLDVSSKEEQENQIDFEQVAIRYPGFCLGCVQLAGSKGNNVLS